MSRSLTYQIRLDEELKTRAFALFSSLGITPAQAIKMFLTQAVNTQSMPIPMQYTPNIETIKAIEEVKQKKNLVVCKDTDDLFSQLGI